MSIDKKHVISLNPTLPYFSAALFIFVNVSIETTGRNIWSLSVHLNLFTFLPTIHLDGFKYQNENELV